MNAAQRGASVDGESRSTKNGEGQARGKTASDARSRSTQADDSRRRTPRAIDDRQRSTRAGDSRPGSTRPGEFRPRGAKPGDRRLGGAKPRSSRPKDSDGRERLHHFLARAGVASRRQAEAMMLEGRITVNGDVATTPGTMIDPARDRIEADGRRVHLQAGGHRYIMLNKPEGVVSTARDPEGRRTVMELVRSERRLFPVGRLDQDSAGLILLTDDGELSLRLTHPRYGVEKTYVVEVRGDVTPDKTGPLRTGVQLEDGLTAPARVKVVRRGRGSGVLEMTLQEGKNREVRRMCGAVGLQVTSLVRTGFGPLQIRGLRPGAHRTLTPNEVAELREAASMTEEAE